MESERVGVRAGLGDVVWNADCRECCRSSGSWVNQYCLPKQHSPPHTPRPIRRRFPCAKFPQFRAIVPCCPSVVASDDSYSYAQTGAVDVAWIVVPVGIGYRSVSGRRSANYLRMTAGLYAKGGVCRCQMLLESQLGEAAGHAERAVVCLFGR